MKEKHQHPQLEPIELAQMEAKNSLELNTLEYEIQCPRCADIMTLCSGFDYLYYSCDECGFVLSNLKK